MCFQTATTAQSTVAVACSVLLDGKIMATCLQANIYQTTPGNAQDLREESACKLQRALSKTHLRKNPDEDVSFHLQDCVTNQQQLRQSETDDTDDTKRVDCSSHSHEADNNCGSQSWRRKASVCMRLVWSRPYALDCRLTTKLTHSHRQSGCDCNHGAVLPGSHATAEYGGCCVQRFVRPRGHVSTLSALEAVRPDLEALCAGQRKHTPAGPT